MQRTRQLVLAAICTMSASILAWGQQTTTQVEILTAPTILSTPWFRNSEVRKELALAENQFKQLENGYYLALRKYQNGVAGLEKVTGKERADKIEQLAADFHKDLMTNANNALSGRQLQRFNELYVQLRAYEGFADPAIRKRLVLSDKQAELMRRHASEYQRDLTGILKEDKDRAAALKQYEELRRVASTKINSALDEEQRRAWRAITGSPYNFQPDFTRPITKD